MTMDRHDEPDNLEEALGELRRTVASPGPSPESLARTRAAMHAAAQTLQGLPLAERIRHMSHARKRLWIAAAVAAVLAGVAFWTLTPSQDNRGVAFADVRAQVERARTMTLTAVAEMKGMKRLVTMKMFFKAPGLMRQEQSIDLTAFLPRGMTQPASMPAKVVTVSIMDMASQKGLSLVPSLKKATTIGFKNMPPEAAAKVRDQDMLAAWKKAMAGPHEDLGDKTIEGRKARGYRCRNAEVMNADMDIWADASTGTPLVVVMTTPDAAGGMKITMSDIVLDPPLDDSLFDLRPAAGYAVENQVMDYNATEADVIGYLDFFTSHFKGAFPRSLMSVPELMEQLKEFKKQGVKEPTEQESKTMQALVQKTAVFLMRTIQGGELVYAGKGVQRGDKATPVLWYKAKDAKAFRVIYGDLHVEDAQQAPKRPATQPAGREQPGAASNPRFPSATEGPRSR
ncbi:MAG: hypothetical protein NTV86_19445 [Planctomycetota bacterium]|nr:hypothetical protein [Planctomycetota bacterium]